MVRVRGLVEDYLQRSEVRTIELIDIRYTSDRFLQQFTFLWEDRVVSVELGEGQVFGGFVGHG